MTDSTLTGWTAAEIAGQVARGELGAREILRRHLARIEAGGEPGGAFERLRPAEAMRDAERIDALPPEARRTLPLAGVPVAIKDNVPVAGLPMRLGSRATRDDPSPVDHPVVARLRAAGAVVVGTTRVPELCLWGTSDNAFGTARSPWNPERTAGGSSGGSAAAVASAFVPVAHGNDGLGSVRIPAACCGLVGIRPGAGVVPSELGPNSWYGLAENGVLATTVADAALVLSVIAGDPALGDIAPGRRMRIGLAISPPAAGFRVDRETARATEATGAALAALGHVVDVVAPPATSPVTALAILGTWMAGARGEVEALLQADVTAWDRLEPRTRMHARLGRIARRLGLADERHRRAWRARMDRFFTRHDLLLTPTLAGPPLAADAWRERSWLANLVANVRVAPYCGPVNFARLPAIALPAGVHPDGSPGSSHLVGPARSERTLLSIAAELEKARPWTRHSPRISHQSAVTPATRA